MYLVNVLSLAEYFYENLKGCESACIQHNTNSMHNQNSTVRKKHAPRNM